AVFGQKQHLNGLAAEEINQVAHDLIDRLQVAQNRRVAWAQALETIIQVRQINQAQSRMVSVFDPLGRFSNPARGRVRRALRRGYSGSRAPKSRKWKFTQVSLDLGPDGEWRGVDVEHLAAIRRIDWPR